MLTSPPVAVQRTRSQKCCHRAGCSRTVLAVTSNAARRKSIQRWALWIAVAIPVAAGISYLLIWYLPDVIARHDVGNIHGIHLQEARDAARGRLLTLGAGLFAAGALLFTGRNYHVARQTLEVTEQGQVTDRFTKAIDHLGSSRIDVRIGGIYALEQVARDSDRDHPIVVEVLSSFIRRHSQRPLTPLGPGEKEPGRSTRPDIQAAITVIGRRDEKSDIHVLDLNHANLAGAILEGAKLTVLFIDDKGVPHLGRAKFTGKTRIGVNLADAKFNGATLKSANLTLASLPRANFTGADLTGANFTGANLTGADFTDAVVEGGVSADTASFSHPNFAHAELKNAIWRPKHDAPAPKGWIADCTNSCLRLDKPQQ